MFEDASLNINQSKPWRIFLDNRCSQLDRCTTLHLVPDSVALLKKKTGNELEIPPKIPKTPCMTWYYRSSSQSSAGALPTKTKALFTQEWLLECWWFSNIYLFVYLIKNPVYIIDTSFHAGKRCQIGNDKLYCHLDPNLYVLSERAIRWEVWWTWAQKKEDKNLFICQTCCSTACITCSVCMITDTSKLVNTGTFIKCWFSLTCWKKMSSAHKTLPSAIYCNWC